MVSPLVSVPLAGGVIVSYAAFRAAISRPRRVPSAPATPDLRDEPPAVVNLLANQLVDAPQVASATLLDLAARGIVEIHQVADDPDHTLVRLRRTGLARHRPEYEQRVVERVARVAGDRFAPVTRLLERYAEGGYQWRHRLVRAAVLDARRRGLIRRSDGGLALALAVAGLAAAAVLAPLLPRPDSDGFAAVALLLGLLWMVLGLAGGILLSAVSFAGQSAQPDRYTAKGRRVTAHWLGVAAWLRAHETLRDLPPAAVAVWDRYLAYGVALDAFPHAARVLDLERVGQRDQLRSLHTGQPRVVRVEYDRRRRLLRPAGPVAAQASLVWAAITLPFWLAAGAVVAATVTSGYPRWLLLVLVAAAAVRSGYRLVRSVVDLVRPVQLTGTVLDIGVAGQQPSADAAEAVGVAMSDLATHYFVVVDDGTSDLLRPWIANRGLLRQGLEPGDQVRLVGQRRSRYVSALERVPGVYQPPEPSRAGPGEDG